MNRFDSPNTPWTLAISGVGVLLGLLLVGEGAVVVARLLPRPVGYEIGVASSLPFIVALVIGGRWLASSGLSVDRHERVAKWCLGGCLGFTVLVMGVTVLSSPASALLVAGTVRWAASIGGGVGFLVGLFEARAIERAIESEQLRLHQRQTVRERDRLEEFASVVSHDLRNPLNVAQGRLELAKETCDSPHLDDVERAHDRMEALIDDLLTLARAGERTDDLEAIVLADVVEAAWQNVATPGATLARTTDRTIEADGNRLQQLLENLFRNAVEHSSTSLPSSSPREDAVEHGSTSPDSHARQDAVEHSSTSLPSSSPREHPAGASSDGPSVAEAPENAVEHDGGGVTIAVGDLDDGFFVADDGPGIPEADRPRVFDVGYTTSEGGTGLGLSIVKDVADAHGWDVRVTESDTGGARFEITGVTLDR